MCVAVGILFWAELIRELQDRRMLSLFLWLGVNSQGLEWYLMSG